MWEKVLRKLRAGLEPPVFLGSAKASGELFDGTKMNGPADLRKALLQYLDQFVQNFVERLFTYAMGRGTEVQDMPVIRAIARDAALDRNRFSAIVLGIVKSQPFQTNAKE